MSLQLAVDMSGYDENHHNKNRAKITSPFPYRLAFPPLQKKNNSFHVAESPQKEKVVIDRKSSLSLPSSRIYQYRFRCATRWSIENDMYRGGTPHSSIVAYNIVSLRKHSVRMCPTAYQFTGVIEPFGPTIPAVICGTMPRY